MSEPTNTEEQLHEAREKLFKVAEYVHSLNQPLTTIFGQLDLLGMKLEGSEHKAFVDKCLEQAERASEILTRIAMEYPRRPDD